MRKNKVTLTVVSFLPAKTEVDLFNRSSSISHNTLINQRKQYKWNITAEMFLQAISVTLQVKLSPASSLEPLTAKMVTSDLQGLLDALNSLKVGVFFSYTSGGSTFVSTLNDYIVYGTLDINATAVTTLGYFFGVVKPDIINGSVIVDNTGANLNIGIIFMGEFSGQIDSWRAELVDSGGVQPPVSSAQSPFTPNTLLGLKIPVTVTPAVWWNTVKIYATSPETGEFLVFTRNGAPFDFSYFNQPFFGNTGSDGSADWDFSQIANYWQSVGTYLGVTVTALDVQTANWDGSVTSNVQIDNFAPPGPFEYLIGGILPGGWNTPAFAHTDIAVSGPRYTISKVGVNAFDIVSGDVNFLIWPETTDGGEGLMLPTF